MSHVHPTARIPELPPLTEGLDLELADKLPIYIVSENKTKQVTLQQLNTFFNTGGGGGSHAPVEFGGEVLYIVPAGHAGTDTAPIPSLAGKDFTLERGGFPMIPLLPDGSNSAQAEYEILNAGGFKLKKAGDLLSLHERFKLTLSSSAPGGGGTTGGSGSFIKGIKNVSTNTVLDPVDDVNVLVQCRAGATAIAITLPSVNDIADNAFIPIEAGINQTKPVTITTSGGQYIYFNNGSKTSIFLMPGEVVWLFRSDDGFYIINDFSDRYRQLAKPIPSYKAELNQLVCKGQELNRVDYPRLWEYIQTLGSSFVSDATWSTGSVTVSGRTVANPYRGCFSSGNGSTTFRMPDLMGMTLTGVISESGSDPQRHLNKPGGFQDDTVKKFWSGSPATLDLLKEDGTNTEIGTDAGLGPNIREGVTIDQTKFSDLNRVQNIGVLWVINA